MLRGNPPFRELIRRLRSHHLGQGHPPLSRRDIFPVSSGTFTLQGKSSDSTSLRVKRSNPRNNGRSGLHMRTHSNLRDCRGRFAPSQRRPFLFCHRVDDVSLLFVDEGYGRNTERNAVVFVGIFFGGFTVCPIAAELEVRRTYGKRLRFGFEMVRSEEVS